MSHSDHFVAKQTHATYLQCPTPSHSRYDDGDELSIWPVKRSAINSFGLSSPRSNRASSSILPDPGDQPSKDCHRDTLRSSIANSDMMWIYCSALQGLEGTERSQSIERPANVSLGRRPVQRQRSFLSRNISSGQDLSPRWRDIAHSSLDADQEADLRSRCITSEVTKPEVTYANGRCIAIEDISRLAQSPENYLHLDSTTSSPNSGTTSLSVDPFSIAHGIIEYTDVPTIADNSLPLDYKASCDSYNVRRRFVEHTHCQMLPSPQFWTSTRYEKGPMKKSRLRRHAYHMATAALILLLAIACIVVGTRLHDGLQSG